VQTPLYPSEAVRTPLRSLETGFQWLSDTKGIELICPDCKTRISTKHYDAEFEWYECPKCEGCFTPDELEEAENGTSPEKRAKDHGKNSKGARAVRGLQDAAGRSSTRPVAKAKKKQQDEDEAVAKADSKALTKKEAADPQVTKHRDQVPTGEILTIVADEIEEIGNELGTTISRLNAREYYAMNLVRPLILKGVSAREKDVPMVKCGEHDS
jgi:hypothetical protein